jgi:hypothetical protein
MYFLHGSKYTGDPRAAHTTFQLPLALAATVIPAPKAQVWRHYIAEI